MYQNGGPKQQGTSYQGYPYVNQIAHDVPSISAEEAARWSRLPRRPAPGIPTHSQPSGSGVQAINELYQDRVNPVSPKVDPDENHVVYIDLPEDSGSDVAERRRVETEDQGFVEDTIFYDPYKDRRIAVPSGDGGSVSSDSDPGLPHIRPTPPNSLSLRLTDRGQSSSYGPISKETSVYGQFDGNEDFSMGRPDLTRQPPPAYTEIDTSLSPSSQTQVSSPSTTILPSPQNPSPPLQSPALDLPRTHVIISPENLSPDHKILTCHGCGVEAVSLITREAGVATHIIATFFMMLGLFPLAILAYCADYFKYKNHYCRYCSKHIGYEIPFLCIELRYVR